MEEASEITVDNLAEVIEEEEENEMEYLEQEGIELYPIDESEIKVWKDELEPLTNEWLDEMEKNGEPAKEIYDAFNDALKNYE